jgi:hypothetical protein
MIVKQLIDEDFTNYKKPSMFIAFPRCTWKCERDCGMRVCQNSALATSPNIDIEPKVLVERYLNNPITSAIIFGGLEPLDSFGDLSYLLHIIRDEYQCNDDVVIYTGFYREEIIRELEIISSYKNVIVKFGRFIPNQQPHYDEVLGVKLASDNQYGKRIS